MPNKEIVPMTEPSPALRKATEALLAKIAEERYQMTLARLRRENERWWANWLYEQEQRSNPRPAPAPLDSSWYASHQHLGSPND